MCIHVVLMYMITDSKMSNSIEKVEQKLNSGVQAKEDLALSLAPHSNLIQQVEISHRNIPMTSSQITPAPLTVAVLAELALLSTAHSDFKLQVIPRTKVSLIAVTQEPLGGFKRLKWTQFKPSLMQVSSRPLHDYLLYISAGQS